MKILSIDFDYIMFPCISLYNDMVGGDANPTQMWQHIEFERKLKEFLSYDANAYAALMDICVRNSLNKAKIVPIVGHEEIITYLEQNCEEFFENPAENTVDNIDFHHDILYNKDDFNEIINHSNASCANWGGYLLFKDLIEEYVWYDAPHSSAFSLNQFFSSQEMENTEVVQEIKCRIDNKFKQKHLKDLSNIQNDYDIIFICLSPQWVPYQFHHLYDLIVSTCNSIIKNRAEEQSEC